MAFDHEGNQVILLSLSISDSPLQNVVAKSKSALSIIFRKLIFFFLEMTCWNVYFLVEVLVFDKFNSVSI